MEANAKTPAEQVADDVLGIPRDVLAKTWEQPPRPLDTVAIGAARGWLRVLLTAEQEAEATAARMRAAAERIESALRVRVDQ